MLSLGENKPKLIEVVNKGLVASTNKLERMKNEREWERKGKPSALPETLRTKSKTRINQKKQGIINLRSIVSLEIKKKP